MFSFYYTFFLFQTSKLLTGVFSKFNKGAARKREDETPPGSRRSSFVPAANEHVVKYFGSVLVTIGTGREPVEIAVKV
jgi:hypothetical protein